MASRGRATARLPVSANGISEGQNGVGSAQVLEIQRARILAAMAEVSGERGAGNVAVAHVVERAGVSRRTFYELYGDRDECFTAAFEDCVARVAGHALAGYDPTARWAERVRTVLVASLSFLEREPHVARLLVVGSLSAGAQTLELRRQLVARLVAAVEEGRAESRDSSELPAATGEGIVGGVLAILHSRLQGAEGSVPLRDSEASVSLLELTGSLMSMIVLPYLGPAVARRELRRPAPSAPGPRRAATADPLRDLEMRLTYRTVRVLSSVAAHPGCSNREVGIAAEINDQGQISKLLTRLHRLGLIENSPAGLARGSPNAWVLTERGREVERAIGGFASA